MYDRLYPKPGRSVNTGSREFEDREWPNGMWTRIWGNMAKRVIFRLLFFGRPEHLFHILQRGFALVVIQVICFELSENLFRLQ